MWRLVDPEGIRFRTGDMLAQPGGPAAYAVFRRNAVAWGHHLVDQVHTHDASIADAERPPKAVSEWSVRLTEEEAHQLNDELIELVERYRDAGRGQGAGEVAGQGDERTTYSVYLLLQPYPELPGAGDNVES